jgi:hypothetical protein
VESLLVQLVCVVAAKFLDILWDKRNRQVEKDAAKRPDPGPDAQQRAS